jgi:hypothetical protein
MSADISAARRTIDHAQGLLVAKPSAVNGGGQSARRSRLQAKCLNFGNSAVVLNERLWAARGGEPEQARGSVLVGGLERQFARVEIRLTHLTLLGF